MQTKAEIEKLKNRIISGGTITVDEAIALSKTSDKEALYEAANQLRLHFMGDKLDMCSIANARSGQCSEDCKWCSQSKYHKTGIAEYDILPLAETMKQALDNDKEGVHRFSLVTSGRALPTKIVDELCETYLKIGRQTKLSLCASMGLLKYDDLKKLSEVGVEHYHCNIESAPSYFDKVCTTHTLDEKIETIKAARKAGMKICSGGIIGMGETMEQRIEMAFTLWDLQVKSIPVNILNPIEGTALEGTASLTDEEILTSIALFRFINPDANIRFAGGRNLITHIQEKALLSGVSAALVGNYLTTIGSNVSEDKAMFKNAGFNIER